jgi:CcmD family protein
MHALAQVPFLAQIATQEEILQHQYEFLSYGLTAAWVILAVYVLMLVGRERKLKREIAGLRAMLEDKQK